jgi:carbon starvation protein CstA
MALGSTMGRVQRDVIGKTLRMAAAGIALGTMALLAVARLIASLLFATSPWDTTTYARMVLALLRAELLGLILWSHCAPINRLRNYMSCADET